MNDILLNDDIEEPYERLIENCEIKKDMLGVDVCLDAGAPCLRALEGGKCKKLDTLIEIKTHELELLAWKKKFGEGMSNLSSNYDEEIAIKNYELGILHTYKNIVDSGDCNVCKCKGTCTYVPQPGQLVRYNCPHFKREDEQNDK